MSFTVFSTGVLHFFIIIRTLNVTASRASEVWENCGEASRKTDDIL
jgi:hypothetical protein